VSECTNPGTSLAGSFYLSYDNGQPFDNPPTEFSITHDSKITIDYEVSVLDTNPLLIAATGGLGMELGGGVWQIGLQPFGNIGTTDGEFNADKTAFTWTLNADLTPQNFYAGFAGQATAVSITEPSACEVDYSVTRVRYDFAGTGSPGPSDFVTEQYVLLRQ